MRKTKYTVKYTTGFKKDYKRAIKRGLKIELLEQVVALLAMGEPLPEKNRDHDLSGDWVGHRECHILPHGLHADGVHLLLGGQQVDLTLPCLRGDFLTAVFQFLQIPGHRFLHHEIKK